MRAAPPFVRVLCRNPACGQLWPLPYQFWTDFGLRPGPALAQSGRIWSMFAEFGPNLGEFGPTLGRIRRKLADAGPTWCEIGPDLADGFLQRGCITLTLCGYLDKAHIRQTPSRPDAGNPCTASMHANHSQQHVAPHPSAVPWRSAALSALLGSDAPRRSGRPRAPPLRARLAGQRLLGDLALSRSLAAGSPRSRRIHTADVGAKAAVVYLRAGVTAAQRRAVTWVCQGDMSQ